MCIQCRIGMKTSFYLVYDRKIEIFIVFRVKNDFLVVLRSKLDFFLKIGFFMHLGYLYVKSVFEGLFYNFIVNLVVILYFLMNFDKFLVFYVVFHFFH